MNTMFLLNTITSTKNTKSHAVAPRNFDLLEINAPLGYIIAQYVIAVG